MKKLFVGFILVSLLFSNVSFAGMDGLQYLQAFQNVKAMIFSMDGNTPLAKLTKTVIEANNQGKWTTNVMVAQLEDTMAAIKIVPILKEAKKFHLNALCPTASDLAESFIHAPGINTGIIMYLYGIDAPLPSLMAFHNGECTTFSFVDGE